MLYIVAARDDEGDCGARSHVSTICIGDLDGTPRLERCKKSVECFISWPLYHELMVKSILADILDGNAWLITLFIPWEEDWAEVHLLG